MHDIEYLVREKKAYDLTKDLSTIQILVDDDTALLNACKANHIAFNRSMTHALRPRMYMVNALEDIFLGIPTDCLEIIADYISSYRNKFDTNTVEQILYETVRLGDVKCFKEASLYTMRDDPFYVGDHRLTSYVNSEGKTLLCVAAENGKVEMVKYLLEQGAKDTSILTIDQHSNALLFPILAAARCGQLEVVKILFDLTDPHLTQIYKTDGSLFEFGNALHWACRYGHIRVIRYLLSRGMDPNSTTRFGSIITDICHLDNPRLLNEILSLPFLDKELIHHPNSYMYTPLTIAASFGFTDMMACLLSHGAKVNRTHAVRSPYAYCCRMGNIKGMKLLEANGFIPDEEEYLVEAAKRGNTHVIRYLVNKGFDINQQATHSSTPLYYATTFGQLKAAKMLLSLGADIHIKMPHGRNAFMDSVTCILSNFEEFIKRGIRLGERDKNKLTATMLLIRDAKYNPRTVKFRQTLTYPRLTRLLDEEKKQGLNNIMEYISYAMKIDSDTKLIKILLEYVTNINYQSSRGNTILHQAIHHGLSMELINDILGMGANIYLENENGQNAFVVALLSKSYGLVSKLCRSFDLEDSFFMDTPDMKLVETCPWMYAIEHYTSLSLRMIRRVKGSIYERFKGEPTGLMIAAKAGNEGIVDYYAKSPMPAGYLDFASEDGNTALMLAAEAGHESIVKTLHTLGADTKLRNKDGKTPLALASAKGYDSITEYLVYTL